MNTQVRGHRSSNHRRVLEPPVVCALVSPQHVSLIPGLGSNINDQRVCPGSETQLGLHGAFHFAPCFPISSLILNAAPRKPARLSRTNDPPATLRRTRQPSNNEVIKQQRQHKAAIHVNSRITAHVQHHGKRRPAAAARGRLQCLPQQETSATAAAGPPPSMRRRGVHTRQHEQTGAATSPTPTAAWHPECPFVL